MRNIKFKEFRQQFEHNRRFILGSNKVMQVVFGRSASDDIHNVAMAINSSILSVSYGNSSKGLSQTSLDICMIL
ncbi:hypothetical protein Bca4012_058408 [Brassica carinata]|uniref:Uncharacterized protein n=1 Tax=Brassica carinata TaxID=52824 RepID=A0A8X7W3H0_BRACI|nr:hypothetical protein Bca52824_016169 [Brassica carinata]